jgi:hypothetical protein
VRPLAGTSLVEFFPWMIYIPQRSSLFSTIEQLDLQLMKRQVCTVEEGSIETICRACQDVSTIIRSCQNGPGTSRYQNVRVGVAIMIHFIGKRGGSSEFQRIIDRTTRSLPPLRAGNGVPLWALVVCRRLSFSVSKNVDYDASQWCWL